MIESAIYDNAPGFIAITEGPGHRFTYANDSYCKLVGRADLVGKTVSAAMPELANQGFLGLLDEVYRTGEPFVARNVPITIVPPGKAERLRYVSFVYQPRRDTHGNIEGLFAEGYDSTSEVVAREQLLAFQEEFSHAARVNTMGMMAATLAHELNQPLTAVSTYAGASLRLLKSGGQSADELAGTLTAIEEAAQRAGAIIRNLRVLTRRGETAKSAFELKTAVEESIKLVRAGLCFDSTIVDRTPSGLVVCANRTETMQVLINLVRNACEAASAGRPNCVEVRAWRAGPDVLVSVQDQGKGLSADAAQDIFNWTDSSKEGGTGLGLSICRTILEAHGGRIWLEDAGGGGCEFRFSLPAPKH